MSSSHAALAADRLLIAPKEGNLAQCEPIFGGYVNARGAISLFAQDMSFRINFKTRILQMKPLLNAGAQRRYDAAEPGEAFEYCGVKFRRLSSAEITEICSSGTFRMGFR